MKFMKLGSRPDTFQTEGNNVRYVASDLASDVVIVVGDVKFYLHKFPLLSKSAKLQKLVITATEANLDEVTIPDIPGGPTAFEICVKFCYGMTVTLNAYNVVMARCAAEYLEMHESVEKGNLIYKIEVFLTSSVFRSWKDSIIVLKSSKSLLPIPDDLKLVTHCIESISSKVAVDTSKVDWSYTYNRKKLPEEEGLELNYNIPRNRSVPQDWWVEDLCELDIDLYKLVISSISSKAAASSEVIGEALKAYVYKWLPGFSKGMIQANETGRSQSIVNDIVRLLPSEKGSVSCTFLLKLLKAANIFELGEKVKCELVARIGQQLEEATVKDLLIRSPVDQGTNYDVDIVRKILLEFVLLDKKAETEEVDGYQIQDIRKTGGILSEASKLMVAKLIDSYLTEISKDPNLPLAKFLELAEMVSGFNRPSHDGLYRAIDTYLKEHPGITKSERKRICKLMDCKKLSVEASMHAVQNERLPLRVVVQVLFFEQVRAAAAASGCSTPDIPKGIKDLANYSHGSSRSATTNTEEADWDAVATVEELKALKGELAALRLANGVNGANGSRGSEKVTNSAAISKMKGLLMSKKVFTRLWSSKGGVSSGGSAAETSGSDSSDGPNPDEGKSTPSRNRRYSVS